MLVLENGGEVWGLDWGCESWMDGACWAYDSSKNVNIISNLSQFLSERGLSVRRTGVESVTRIVPLGSSLSACLGDAMDMSKVYFGLFNARSKSEDRMAARSSGIRSLAVIQDFS